MCIRDRLGAFLSRRDQRTSGDGQSRVLDQLTRLQLLVHGGHVEHRADHREAFRVTADRGVARHHALEQVAVGDRGRGQRHLRRAGGNHEPEREIGRHGFGGTGTADQAFEQTVGGQPVRSVQTRASDLADGVQTGHSGASVDRRNHTTAREVGRRGDGDRVHRRINPHRDARRVHGREPGSHVVQRSRVQEDVVVDTTGFESHVPGDRGRHDVTRSQIFQRVHALHHARTGRVDQHGTLAAHCFRDERAAATSTATRVENRRVELDELDIGRQSTGTQRQSQPVTRRHGRVRGRLVHLADTTGGQQNRGRGQHTGHAVAVQHQQAAHRTQRRLHRVDRDVVLQQGNPSVHSGLQKRPFDLGTRRVTAGVHDAERAVPTFAGPLQQTVRARVEHRAALAQPRDRGRSTGDDRRDRGLVTQARTRRQRVLDVPPHRVAGVVLVLHDHRDAALSPAGVAVVARRLRDDENAKPQLTGVQCGRQPRHARTDHDQVGPRLPARGHHSPPPGWPISIMRCTAP